jgi:hypothetical protein
MRLLVLTAIALIALTGELSAQSWGRGGGYTGASRSQGYYPGSGVHRCTWAISAGCAAWRARGGKIAPGRWAGQRHGAPPPQQVSR